MICALRSAAIGRLAATGREISVGGMGAVAAVVSRIEGVTALQRERSFILTGLYLNEGDLCALRPLLKPDEPNTGAVGRFDGVPVRSSAEFPGGKNSGEHSGIQFTWVPMLAVD